MIYEYRNAKYHKDGGIDCEIHHPKMGWLPHLVHVQDNANFFNHIEKEGGVAPYKASLPTNADVNTERDRRILLGTSINLPSGTIVSVAGDAETTRNLQGLAVAAQARIAIGDSTTTPYRDENNVIHNLSPQEIFMLWSLGSAFVSGLYQASWALKDATGGIPHDYQEDHHWTSS